MKLHRMLGVALALVLLAACRPGPVAVPRPVVPTTPTPLPPAATSAPVEITALPTAAAATRVPTETAVAWVQPDHRIQIRMGAQGAEFYDTATGEVFVPRGANYVKLVWTGSRYEDRLFATDVWDAAAFRSDMQALAERGYNTVRIFVDSCSGGPTCIALVGAPGLNGAYLDNMVEAMRIAREAGIFIQFTSNDIPDHGGYGELANAEASVQIAGYRNAHMLTASGHRAAQHYWRDLLQGLTAREAPLDAVLGWQLLNEQWLFGSEAPLSLVSGEVAASATGGTYDMASPDQQRDMVADAVEAYIATMAAEIKTHDPTALVTMGFFSPQFPNATGIGGMWYVDTASLIERDVALDYFDFHAYPGSDISLPQIAENFGMLGYSAKPVVLGEYGAFVSQYDTIEAAARVSAEYMTTACELGFDGMLYWTYLALPGSIGDNTWGMVEAGGYLRDLFAPNAWPYPCIPVEIPTDNLALNASVTASQAPLPAEPASNAVDGDNASQWGAGGDAVQWIEIDLGVPRAVQAVRLLVAQYPAGETRHRVYVAGPDRGFSTLTEFAGSTADGDWLEFTLDTPQPGIQFVRVETLHSPSWVAWREIEVIGE